MTEYHFDEEAANAACAFFPHFLRLTKGRFAGRPFELMPWMRDEIIRPVFGWKKPDGFRRYRKVYIEVPKKNAKTELAAGVAHLMLMADAEMGGEGYFIASKADQAKIAFTAASRMVQFSPHLAEHLTAFKTKIVCPELVAQMEPLAGSSKGMHGKNPSFIIGDEVHEWVDDDLYQFLATGMAVREQPLEFLITTAGETIGYGHEMHLWAEKIRDGIIEDPETLVVIYGAEMEDDWTDREVWKRSNPSLGVTVLPEYLEFKFREAKEDDLKEANFRRYHLNQWVKQAKFWLKPEKWAVCCEIPWQRMMEQMRGREAFVGIDLSSVEDITAVAWVFPPAGADHKTRIAIRLYIPEDNIERRVRMGRVPYDRWVKEKAIQTTDGNTVDQEKVFADIVEDAERYNVRRVGHDKWGSAWIGPKLVDHFGEDAKKKPVVLKVQQGYATMSPGAKELERLMLSGLLDHGGHPVLKWMASNVVVKQGDQGDLVPIKSKSTEKIDGIVGVIIALSCQVLDEIPTGPIRFQREGLLVI